jgi:hypothetical protein
MAGMDVSAQVDAIENGALVRPMPELVTLAVSGEERLSWLAGMLTQDIGSLEPGQGAYALSVNKSGRLQAEVWVAIADERVLLGIDAKVADALLEAMDHYLIMEDAEIARADEPLAWWLVHGPEAEAVAKLARGAGATAALTRWGEIDTALVIAPHGGAPNMAEVLTATEGATLATPSGWEHVRIQRLLPRFGVDFEVDVYPQEASLENLGVSFNKGCYIGQEAVFMLAKRGHVSKRLVRLLIDGKAEVDKGAVISTPDGKAVGTVTSVSQAGDQTMAIGLVRYKHTASGTKLSLADQVAEVSCIADREGSC